MMVGQHDVRDVGETRAGVFEGPQNDVDVIGPHERVDEGDVASAPDHDRIDVEGERLRSDDTRR